MLTVTTGKRTWVLNLHNVSQQLWLSSPVSGPSKYNLVKGSSEGENGKGANGVKWVNERNPSLLLTTLLTNELSTALGAKVNI